MKYNLTVIRFELWKINNRFSEFVLDKKTEVGVVFLLIHTFLFFKERIYVFIDLCR